MNKYPFEYKDPIKQIIREIVYFPIIIMDKLTYAMAKHNFKIGQNIAYVLQFFLYFLFIFPYKKLHFKIQTTTKQMFPFLIRAIFGYAIIIYFIISLFQK